MMEVNKTWPQEARDEVERLQKVVASLVIAGRDAVRLNILRMNRTTMDFAEGVCALNRLDAALDESGEKTPEEREDDRVWESLMAGKMP
jgi:hypothetical protein